MRGGSTLDNWKQSWTPPLLSKNKFDDNETKLLTLGMRLASTPPEVHQGWIGDDISSTTVTDVLVGVEEIFE